MVQYLLWRSMTERHTRITLSFLAVGHTKFSPDWCFWLLKRLYRRTVVGSLMDIAEVCTPVWLWIATCTLQYLNRPDKELKKFGG